MTDDSYRQGIEEIARIRSRLAELEAMAAKGPPIGLSDALADAMSPLQAPVDPARRKLQNAAHGWQPDDQMEAAVKARDRDPAAYAAEMARVGASNGLEMALYESSRTAAIAVGAWTEPTTTEGDAS